MSIANRLTTIEERLHAKVCPRCGRPQPTPPVVLWPGDKPSNAPACGACGLTIRVVYVERHRPTGGIA